MFLEEWRGRALEKDTKLIYKGATVAPLAEGAPCHWPGTLVFLSVFIGFPCIFRFLRDFRVRVSLVFGGVCGRFQSVCFSRLFLLTMA